VRVHPALAADPEMLFHQITRWLWGACPRAALSEGRRDASGSQGGLCPVGSLVLVEDAGNVILHCFRETPRRCQVRHGVAPPAAVMEDDKHLAVGLRAVVHAGLVRGQPRTLSIDSITVSDEKRSGERAQSRRYGRQPSLSTTGSSTHRTA
jgi:hypothetical protein